MGCSLRRTSELEYLYIYNQGSELPAHAQRTDPSIVSTVPVLEVVGTYIEYSRVALSCTFPLELPDFSAGRAPLFSVRATATYATF